MTIWAASADSGSPEILAVEKVDEHMLRVSSLTPWVRPSRRSSVRRIPFPSASAFRSDGPKNASQVGERWHPSELAIDA
jgi:hypothetical protein